MIIEHFPSPRGMTVKDHERVYVLSALVARQEAVARAAIAAGVAEVGLPQGYGLVAVTPAVLDRLGSGDAGEPFGEPFFALSAGVEALARRVSHTGPIAFLDVEFFGGEGTQAAVVWRDGGRWLGPVTTEFGWPPPDLAGNPQWAVNSALRALGVDRGRESDEFEALGLGRRRHTEDWQPAS